VIVSTAIDDSLWAHPADNAGRVPLYNVFEWDSNQDALYYEVFIGTERNSLEPAGRAGSGALRSRLAMTLLPSTRYYWRVDTLTRHSGVLTGQVRVFDTSFDLLEDVTSARAYRYDSKDDQFQRLDGLKVIENPGGGYLGVYHSHIYNPSIGENEFQLRLASSNDLMNWTYVRTLVENADMPAIEYHPGTGGYFLVHEQWGSPGSRGDSNLGFKYYPDTSSLLSGTYTHNYIAPFSGFHTTNLEGTPNFYDISADGNEINVGFHHFTRPELVDNIARGTLTGFLSGSPVWGSWPETAKNAELRNEHGIGGNIGDRDFGEIFGREYTVQEAQYTPNAWETWRGWYYDHQTSGYSQLFPLTHGGTLNYGNMTYSVLTSPSGRPAVFCSYFVFGEGAAAGEAGELIFYSELVTKARYPVPSNAAKSVNTDIGCVYWAGGAGAAKHRVYLSSNAADVYYAEPAAYIGEFSGSWAGIDALECFTKYYWRVDQVTAGGGITEGELWSFTTGSAAADLSGDCKVDWRDFVRMAASWLGTDCGSDVSGDCYIDIVDLKMLAAGWLQV
jgi:hypothetical protein